MSKLVRETVSDAFDFEITDWRERQIDALNQITYPKVESPDRFKAFAWLNFGVNAVDTLFPVAGLGKLLTAATEPYAIPIWIIGQVQTQFQKVYDETVKDSERLLNAKFDDLKDSFIKQAQDQARLFRISNYGRAFIDKVYDYMKDTDYGDDDYMVALLREIVHQSKLVVTDPAKIRNLTQSGYGSLMEKIAMIWKGSYHSDAGKGIVFGHSQTGGTENAKWIYVKKRDAHDQQDRIILAHAAEFEVWEDSAGYTRVFKSGRSTGVGGHPESYMGPDKLDLPRIVPLAIQSLPSPRRGGAK